MNRNDSEWLANLFSELIRMGIDEDEHQYWKDRGFKNFKEDRWVDPPAVDFLDKVDMEEVVQLLYPQLMVHLEQIIADYRRES